MNKPMINISVKLNIDKNAVANSFSKAAHSYDHFAQLQRDIGNQLFRQLSNKSYGKTLDLGCGTGYFSAKLLKKNITNELICLDLSKGMLDYLKMERGLNVPCIQADMDHLPFSENNFDNIFSNLALQWSSDLHGNLQQLRQSLVIGGELHFSTLLEGSLNELSNAWKCIDNKPHINTFITRSDIEQILAQINRQNSAKLQGRSMIHKLEQAYKVLANQSGSLPLSYQVCFIKAIK